MKQESIRVRFAPSPTGWMHLGNVRAALINALFAHKENGTFILRIEDTDQERLADPGGKQIMNDLSWLGLNFGEGPYFQSERSNLYTEQFEKLKEKKLVYRCFETPEELEEQRKIQLAQGLPPRYNRAALNLTEEEIQKNLDAGKPFIWRFKLPEGHITITDLARGTIEYDFAHFSDFAITRQDGSFTFIFANFVDDMLMNITHVFRGEDHITNSANQAALYQAFNREQPIFYHLPLICNIDGKKLSKRDFGFSLDDLRTSGFIPEAICNYLAIIGGSFKQEIMSFDELAHTLQFDRSSPTGSIQYDVEKLRWINQKWIAQLPTEELVTRCLPLLQKQYSTAISLEKEKLVDFLSRIQGDMVTLHDSVEFLSFYFVGLKVSPEILEQYKVSKYRDFFSTILKEYKQQEIDPAKFFTAIKQACKKENKPLKEVFTLLRLALTSKPQGLGIKDLIAILGIEKTLERIRQLAL